MSTASLFGNTETRTVTIDSDLSSKAGFLVALDTTDDLTVNIASGATAFPFVLTEDGDGSSTAISGSIAIGGRVKVKLGGTVVPGDKITSDGTGKGIKTTTDTNHYGLIMLENGVTGDVKEALVSFGMVAG
jgi:hypothetical protein